MFVNANMLLDGNRARWGFEITILRLSYSTVGKYNTGEVTLQGAFIESSQ